jgi:23S rRNA (cytosine1962-C5)-methyltransferase
VETALRRYGDANKLALQACASGAVLLTCSCSGALSEERFLHCLQRAAVEAGRDVQVLAVCGAGADHPVALECPETRYLKAVFLRVR